MTITAPTAPPALRTLITSAAQLDPDTPTRAALAVATGDLSCLDPGHGPVDEGLARSREHAHPSAGWDPAHDTPRGEGLIIAVLRPGAAAGIWYPQPLAAHEQLTHTLAALSDEFDGDADLPTTDPVLSLVPAILGAVRAVTAAASAVGRFDAERTCELLCAQLAAAAAETRWARAEREAARRRESLSALRSPRAALDPGLPQAAPDTRTQV